LASHATGETTLRIIDDQTKEPSEIRLTPGLSNLLTELLRHIGNGDAVTLVPVSQRLSTQQAADILNVSQPFLISLLDKGEIDHELVGRHRRIKAEALFAYKRGRNARRSKALDDLAGFDGEPLA
jgi:excisionase family DNA binding protein